MAILDGGEFCLSTLVEAAKSIVIAIATTVLVAGPLVAGGIAAAVYVKLHTPVPEYQLPVGNVAPDARRVELPIQRNSAADSRTASRQ